MIRGRCSFKAWPVTLEKPAAREIGNAKNSLLTPIMTGTSVEIDTETDLPMNLNSSKPAIQCERSQKLQALLLLCLMISCLNCGAAGSSASLATNFPTIYTAKALPEVTNGLGFWIWDKVTLDKQTVRLRKILEVPKDDPVVGGELRIAADNAFTVWLDGQKLGMGSDWRTLSIYHLEGRMDPGKHVLAVEGFNDNDQAGVILGLSLNLASGRILRIRSDLTWYVVPNSESDWNTTMIPENSWPNASVAANFGRVPWWIIPTSVLHIRTALPKPVPFWMGHDFQIGLFAGCIVFVVICIYLLIRLLIQSKAHNLVQAERDRIARDIHDDLGSKLTQLLLSGEVAQIESGSHSSNTISQMCDGARNILATIDEVVWIVNSQNDNIEDFVIYVCKYAQRFLESSPIRCRFDVPQDPPPLTLSELTRRNLFLAVKEALNNAVKHSRATELEIFINLAGHRLNVVVTDNGRGFDCTRMDQTRNGIANMNQRMAEINGSCQVASRQGEGCVVSFQIPLKQPSFLKSLFLSGKQNDSTPVVFAAGSVFPGRKTQLKNQLVE